MTKQPKLNVLSVWERIPHDGLYTKQYNANRTYSMPSGVVGVASYDKPVFAYAKSYKKNNQDFSLFMYSDSKNAKSVEKFFDESVKNVTKEDISEALTIASTNGFKYLDIDYKE